MFIWRDFKNVKNAPEGNLLIDADLIQKTRDHGLVISKFLENKLQEYFQFIDVVSKPKGHSKGEKVGLSEFESESLAPKAKRMDQATLQAQHTRWNNISYLKIMFGDPINFQSRYYFVD
jgi:hypothetical protein